MKNSKFLFVVGFLVISSASFGQEYAFKVMASKGSSEVKSGSNWAPIKIGASLNEADELKVAENSYLALVNHDGKSIEVKKAGPYKVADLLKTVPAGTSVLNKYTDFILSSNSAEQKKNRLSATGAVSRGMEDIMVFLPVNEQSVFGNIVVINWESKGAKPPFIVTLKNLFDDQLMRQETSEYSLEINLSDPALAREKNILVFVSSKADPKNVADSRGLKRLSDDESKRIKAELGTDVQENTAISYYLLAAFYEKNRLLIDAITAYEEAIKLEPSYKEYYDDFLVRNNFKHAPTK